MVPPESYVVRGTRIIWRGGGRPQSGLGVELDLARSLYSRAALAAALLLGLLAGAWLASSLDLAVLAGLAETELGRAWTLLGQITRSAQ